MKPLIIECPICQTKFDYDKNNACCHVCGWMFDFLEEDMKEDEKSSFNSMSIREAKKLYSQGLTIFGDKIENHKSDA